MSKIKYVSSSGLTHYDEKIKKVIDEVDTSTNTKVTQTPTSTDASYPLLLSPSGQTQETNTTSYFNSGVVLNPSTKTISANIDGNAKTATKATSADKLNANAGSATQPTYFADGIPKACTYKLEKSVPADAVFTDTKYTNQIGMTNLGFTTGATCTVHEFFTAIYEKGYSGKISLRFRYDNSSTAKISDGTTTIDMNGVDCYISCHGDTTWRKDYAIVSQDNKSYLLYVKYNGSTTPNSQGIVELTNPSLIAGIFPSDRVIYKQIACANSATITVDLAEYIDVKKFLKFTVCIKCEHPIGSAFDSLSLNNFKMWFEQGTGGANYATGFYYTRCTYSNMDTPNITIGTIKRNGSVSQYELTISKNDDNTLSITNNGLYGTYIGILIMPTEFEQLTNRIDENADTYAKKDEIAGTYAKSSIYGDTVVSMGRKADTTVGTNSFAFGYDVTASGDYSHAEGSQTTASANSSHAEGYHSTASATSSHAEGWAVTASGQYSHAEGGFAEARNNYSHAEGYHTTASGDSSHAEGYYTTALMNQHAQGHYNNTTTATPNSTSGTSDGTAFVIGNGSSGSKSNAFRVTGKGVIYATNATVQTGADYAEYFEWSDGNPNEEDRVGYFVTFDEDNPEKIRIASKDDYILGIVSGMPNIIGNGDECWKQRYILDDFGRYIEETFEYDVEVPEVVEKEVEDEETGETKIVEEVVIHKETKIGTKWKENPEYDPTQPYIPRDKRAEWSATGMLGVLSVYDDGTCQVNGYCKVADGGIATACEKGEGAYRVIKRVTDNIVKVVLK